ncbi:Histone-lysine N-methyltransferase SETMAR, partial [Ooceraea biroi]
LLHDNALSHKTIAVRQFVGKKGIVMLDRPPYSPDLAPCDYFLFPKLKIAVKGTRYNDITDIEAAVTEVLNDISKQDLERSFEMLATRSQRYIDAEGAYFE